MEKRPAINLLAIGLDYLMLKDDRVRGDVRSRQLVYAQAFESFHLLVYAPKSLGFQPQKWAENLFVYPSGSAKKAFFIWDAFRMASRICRDHPIDAITTEDPFTTGIVGYLLKRKYRLPLNVQVHIDFVDNQYWMGLRKINWFFNVLGKFILKQADTVRCGTHYEKRKLVRLGINPDVISVIPVNSLVKKFQGVQGDAIRRQYLGERFGKLLLFTGRLVKQKDLPTLFKAMTLIVKELPTVRLLIVGTGGEEIYLKTMAAAMGLTDHIVFTGSVPHDDIPEYLAACDVYVVPSIFEGTCIAMTEAMSAGKAVVVTGFAGAEDLVKDGETGYKVPVRDHQRMAQRILSLLNDPGKANLMGAKASAVIAEIFSNNLNIEKVIALWTQTASRGQQGLRP